MSAKTKKPKLEIVDAQELARRYARHHQKERETNSHLDTFTAENHFLMALLYGVTGRFSRKGYDYHIPINSELHSNNL